MSEETLNPEILQGIKPFSGTPDEMSVAERLVSEGKSLQRVQAPYVTAVAVQKPRSMTRVVKNVLEESKLAGSAFFYRWEVKNRKTGRKSIVQGPSIDLAMCIARNYGNCALDIDVAEVLSHYLFKGTFIDLETGFTVPRLFRQRKRQDIGGGYGDDRSEDIVFQIGQSKVQRNCIVKAAPGWLVDQAIEVARQAEINTIKPENIHIARAKVLDFFATYGVIEARIERKLECKADEWTAENIADLRAMATALKEGRIGPDELFPDIEPDEPPIKQTAPGAGKDSSGSQKEPGPISLYDRLMKARPKTSEANKQEFIKAIADHADEIRAWPPDQYKELSSRFLRLFPGEVYPAAPIIKEDPPSSLFGGFKQDKPPEKNTRRLNYLDNCHKAKEILGNERYYAVLSTFSMSSMNTCPDDPAKEQEVLDALNCAVDQMNTE